MMTADELDRLLLEPEGENLEFKEAKTKFGVDELTKYCVALANERGGRIVFGVTDRRPRRVVGSAAFPQPELARKTVLDRLKVPVSFDVIEHSDGRVVVFTVASRPNGVLLQYDGQLKERIESYLGGFRLDGQLIGELEAGLNEPGLERKQLRRLLLELQDEQRIHSEGENRWTRYFAGGPQAADAS